MFFGSSQPRTLIELVDLLVDLLNSAIPVFALLALLGFAWGVAMLILNADNEEERKKGKQIILWGLVALFVIGTIGGILAVLRYTFIEF